jgi:peptide/nickel transport system permease protein
MARFITRRAIHAVVLVFITIATTFFLLHLAPGDPLSRYYSPEIDPAAMDRVRNQLGLDEPIHVQFFRWLSSVAQGDFGMSLSQQRPVRDILIETIPRTLQLTVLAFLVQIAIGVVAGTFAASRRGRFADGALSVTMLILYAVPAFYLAYLLITFFSLQLDWLPTSGMRSIGAEPQTGWAGVVDRLRHLALPVVVLGVARSAWLARHARGGMVDALAEDHIRTARAKGVAEGTVVWRHAFRGSLPPLLTAIGLSVPFLLGGAVVVEKVFAWPGMGALVVDSIFARDYPVLLATNVVAAIMVILGNFLADLSVALADPRTKLASPQAKRATG